MRTIRLAFALTAFLIAVAVSRPALADVTIQGTAGEIAVVNSVFIGGNPFVLYRFKFTDANQTATCTDQSNGGNQTTKYAYFLGTNLNSPSGAGDYPHKEWYAALLVSKKGAPLTCTVKDGQNCRVTSCTLP